MPNNDEQLDALLTKLGKPTTSQIQARRRWSVRLDWAILLVFLAGLALALSGIKIGIYLLLSAAVGYVAHSNDREASFMSLIILMVIAAVLLSVIGYLFDIPGLIGTSGTDGGVTGGF